VDQDIVFVAMLLVVTMVVQGLATALLGLDCATEWFRRLRVRFGKLTVTCEPLDADGFCSNEVLFRFLNLACFNM